MLAIGLGALAGGTAEPAIAQTCMPLANYIPIANYADLSTKVTNPSDNYCLTGDIDASKSRVRGFVPIGGSSGFSGTFDGQGHVINNLFISSDSLIFGLFTVLNPTGLVRDVGLTNLSVTGPKGYDVGGLTGRNLGTIANSYTTGSVNGTASNASTNQEGIAVGGLVGYNFGTIEQSYSSATVSSPSTGTATNSVALGGLSGGNIGYIFQSYATGPISGQSNNNGDTFFPRLGGLVGENLDLNGKIGTIVQSFSTGMVLGGNGSIVGGLVGENYSGVIENSYATGLINVGTGAFSSIANSYYYSEVGGLVGDNHTGSISLSYAAGKVTGGQFAFVGGLTAYPDGQVTNSYWDTVSSGVPSGQQSASTTGTGLTTDKLKAGLQSGFVPSIWSISSTDSYPFLLAPDTYISETTSPKHPKAPNDFGARLATFWSTLAAFSTSQGPTTPTGTYTSVPIGQLQKWQYQNYSPGVASGACVGTVFTMIAHLIGDKILS